MRWTPSSTSSCLLVRRRRRRHYHACEGTRGSSCVAPRVADEHLTEEQSDMIESASELLYGLIHARFILTSRGMAVMVSLPSRFPFPNPCGCSRSSASRQVTRVVCSRSWKSSSTSTLAGVHVCTAKGSPACQWVSQISHGNGL
jgi:hypothetical protein